MNRLGALLAPKEREGPQLLQANTMARRLHVTLRWLKDEADAGRLPHIKAGDRYLFNTEAVDLALLERAKTVPAVQAT